ncbi:MAG: PAS domain-containing protein [Minwuia sp.]|uniref:PAS domain-containing protein n=1 Tax=Minwuia sp. TaxID=2493630 RepID=UPI003A838A6E
MSLEIFQDPAEEDIADPTLRALWLYWQSLSRRKSSLPSRRDIDPADMQSMLPWTFLIDPKGEGGYRYRLVGTRIVKDMGYDMTGQLVARAYAGPDWPEVKKDYDFVVARGQACMTYNSVVLVPSNVHYTYARLLLPLASDGETVDMLLGGAVQSAPRQRA